MAASDNGVSKDEDAINQFQRYVWDRLPMRKYLCGHDKVFDIVAVIVQEWPVPAIERSRSGETEEVVALEELAKSIRRHLHLVYGEVQWELWQHSITPIVWQCIFSVLHWYRDKDQNAQDLWRWRSKWRKRTR